MPSNSIETHNLTKIYRRHLGIGSKPSLNSLDLAIEENEVFGFLGKNGAGKTTAIKILCGLIRPTRGTAAVCGIDVRKRAARTLVGYLPENPYFYEYLNPKETLSFYGKLKGLSWKERRAERDKLCELLDLGPIADQRVREFSKGMRQRLGFAVALVGDPSLLILDEPMSGLDPLGRRAIRELILFMSEQKKTIFFSSHVLGDVEQLCDRVGILIDGELSVTGRINELLTRKVDQVEIIARGLPKEVFKDIAKKCIDSRLSEEGAHFILSTIEKANDITYAIQTNGGTVLEFTPLKESLEDYFMRTQAAPEKKAAGPPDGLAEDPETPAAPVVEGDAE
jgi:ABC-2 type transport system ATP-binding protein